MSRAFRGVPSVCSPLRKHLQRRPPLPPVPGQPRRLRLSDSAPAWQRAAVRWLRVRRYPTWPLLLALYPGGKFWACLVAWILGAHVAAALDLGPIYILATLFALMGLNMGRRAAGAPSAYSIFNGLRRLPGQLTAEDLDHQLRHGQM